MRENVRSPEFISIRDQSRKQNASSQTLSSRSVWTVLFDDRARQLAPGCSF